jgi:hypothetical protein
MTYLSVATTSPTLDMKGFLATGVSFAEKQQSVRHGYTWVPTDQGLSRPRQAGPTYQKTR